MASGHRIASKTAHGDGTWKLPNGEAYAAGPAPLPAGTHGTLTLPNGEQYQSPSRAAQSHRTSPGLSAPLAAEHLEQLRLKERVDEWEYETTLRLKKIAEKAEKSQSDHTQLLRQIRLEEGAAARIKEDKQRFAAQDASLGQRQDAFEHSLRESEVEFDESWR